MHQQSDNSKFYVKFYQPSFGLSYPHPWHQSHYAYHHRDHMSTLITCLSPPLPPQPPPSAMGSLLNCPHCDRTFTPRIGLVGYLRIHGTETGEPVPGAPTNSRDHHPRCPHCSRTFAKRMGLLR
ncbi:unnamed protein product [Schistocephalus solidus]|uniref:C2H2-type domain-containing protein n=1 Tax=Schistocephalus solidus TaxID=70667 RepID=A0A183TE97_SCHSO|nr:unnamed protein product [Schistocephalus solidus]